tara:strand:+ start:676 stop:969 length:294 start_codon:yes stop_codon:yes gene_type:complete
MNTYITKPVLITLAVICLAVAGADFIRDGHGYFPVEHFPLVYCAFGFVVYGALIILAKGLRVLIERPENYYGDLAVDAEPEPGMGPDAPEKIEVAHD